MSSSQAGIASMSAVEDNMKGLDEEKMEGKSKKKSQSQGKRRKTLNVEDETGAV